MTKRNGFFPPRPMPPATPPAGWPLSGWAKRTIGPGRDRDAAPTQPLEDTPAAAHVIGWLPQDEIDAAEREAAPAGPWERWLARCVIAAVAAFVLFVACGGGGA